MPVPQGIIYACLSFSVLLYYLIDCFLAHIWVVLFVFNKYVIWWIKFLFRRKGEHICEKLKYFLTHSSDFFSFFFKFNFEDQKITHEFCSHIFLLNVIYLFIFSMQHTHFFQAVELHFLFTLWSKSSDFKLKKENKKKRLRMIVSLLLIFPLAPVQYQSGLYRGNNNSSSPLSSRGNSRIVCGRCGEVCRGEVVRVKTTHFHVHCFTCQGKEWVAFYNKIHMNCIASLRNEVMPGSLWFICK